MLFRSTKYTPDGGTIDIRAETDDDSVKVTVVDNGIGIPAEDVSRVFDRFYRVDKARGRESGGTGLGLSIANEIIMRHNGKIDVESRYGEGTTMIVTIPVEGSLDAE